VAPPAELQALSVRFSAASDVAALTRLAPPSRRSLLAYSGPRNWKSSKLTGWLSSCSVARTRWRRDRVSGALRWCSAVPRLADRSFLRRLTPSLLRGGPLSSVHRLALECEDGSHLSVVLKTAPLGVGRSLASANKHFEREVGFYKCATRHCVCAHV